MTSPAGEVIFILIIIVRPDRVSICCLLRISRKPF